MILTQFGIGILSSILAAGLFLYLLSRLKPDISISEQISKSKSGNTTIYKIKIINYGRRDAINIRIEASLMRTKNVAGGIIYVSEPLKLKRSEWMVLQKYTPKSKEAGYAFRITILEALEKVWNDDDLQYIRIKIFAQDEMSNFGKVFVREYRTKRNSIKNGDFAFGDTMEIL